MENKKTSWGHVSGWYDKLIERGEDTYQKQVVLPNLVRLMDVTRGETVLDLACGQGFFSRELEKQGANVIAVDISPELIARARTHAPKSIRFEVSPADNLSFLKNNSIDVAVIVLAIQNIEDIDGVLKECGRVLKTNGKFFIVMNHPAFRIPKESSWGWDEKLKTQYRRVDRYLSEITSKIIMNPGANDSKVPFSAHKDRHEHIGDGHIGVAGFKLITSFAKKHDIDMMLETEYDKVAEDVKILKKLRGK